MPSDPTLARSWLASLFIQGVVVFLLEALLGVGRAGLRQLVLVGGWERFPAPSLRRREGVAHVQGLLEDGAGCGGHREGRKENLPLGALEPVTCGHGSRGIMRQCFPGPPLFPVSQVSTDN